MSLDSEERDDRYRVLTRTELRHFDKDATQLILEMGEDGWVGRVSSKGHAIMRAPDGIVTSSVSRDSLRGRSGRNARAAFTRWQREQEKEVSLAMTETVQETTEVPEQLLEFAERGRKAQEAVDSIVGIEVRLPHECPEPDCEFRAARPQEIGIHRRKVHGYVSQNPKAIASRKASQERKAARKAGETSEYPQIEQARTERVERAQKVLEESWEVSLTDLIGEAGVAIVQDRLDSFSGVGLTWEIRMRRASRA